MTATQVAVRWLVDVSAVVHVFEHLGALLPEAECDTLLDRLERLGEVALPSADTWGTLAAVVRHLHQATEAVGHPLAPLLHCWESDLMRARDRAAQEAGPWAC
jgi:hypothetical protein